MLGNVCVFQYYSEPLVKSCICSFQIEFSIKGQFSISYFHSYQTAQQLANTHFIVIEPGSIELPLTLSILDLSLADFFLKQN